MRGRGARADDAEVRPLRPGLYGDHAGRRVTQKRRNSERGHLYDTACTAREEGGGVR